MNESQRNVFLDVTKHLVTLAIAALGFVITIMFTSLAGEPLLKATEYKNSLQTSLISFLICVVLGFLVQASVLSHMLGEQPRVLIARPRFLLAIAWVAFIVGIVALFVFAWASTFGGAPIGL
jgi:hypothetical protein